MGHFGKDFYTEGSQLATEISFRTTPPCYNIQIMPDAMPLALGQHLTTSCQQICIVFKVSGLIFSLYHDLKCNKLVVSL